MCECLSWGFFTVSVIVIFFNLIIHVTSLEINAFDIDFFYIKNKFYDCYHFFLLNYHDFMT